PARCAVPPRHRHRLRGRSPRRGERGAHPRLAPARAPARLFSRPPPQAGARGARLLGSASPVHVRGFLGALLAKDGAHALEAIDRAARDGEDLTWLCREGVETARRALVVKVAPEAPFADLTPAEHAALAASVEGVSADELIFLLRAFMDADAEMRRSPHPRVELGIAAVRAARRPQPQASEALITEVDEAAGRRGGA